MSDRDFAYWLNGFLEISNAKSLDETQTQIIKDHLALVFKKLTPNRTTFDENGFMENFNIGLPDPIYHPVCSSSNPITGVVMRCAGDPKPLHPYHDGTLVEYHSQGSC